MHDLFYSEDVFQDYDHDDKRRRGIEFTIDYQGRWYYHGLQSPGPIKRKALAGLFGGAGAGFMAGKGLSIDENGTYWLKSPESRYQVEVEDVPFIITRYDIHNSPALSSRRKPGSGRDNNEPDPGFRRDDSKEGVAIDVFTNFDEKIELGPDHLLVLKAEPQHNVKVLYAEIRAGLWARFSTQVYNEFATRLMTVSDGHYQITSRGHTFKLDTDETEEAHTNP